ncbi:MULTISPECIES: potassium-transporting ATPase subunit KdpB [Paenibacillus]|jgi:K+-transporting ATPase ATPase B chain|uniref:Potassium-transporting ATPase ATP-binding subunit n=1 Tax=Paenibacillus odorifer TaxID=189426 RepID=A0AB36J6J3_9BACL|nr:MULTISPECIES: potassium-transporting ATPase subunit KdpB [Paenibacillus]MDH6429222.1 K+-transporting ATPase ATPase B chain [Paenibacillus sp. PastH-4]MDH6445429.1 K+-transporting ATPase ATPase B chain [Paenibacillus sp. PastF-4]MDH6529317.1 K+-transporting ATPase ATPase B chain [Paenibacillus sp. PastH-3]OMD14539.1 potassium-transporting ATPase subunit B [Paenibacillus odorifer]OMD57360.1 potassium-transporting ATPase subunit B [Paenibacillus odorifer]
MSTVKRKKLLTGPILLSAVKDSFIKLNPVTLIKNPVMFVVEIGTIIVLLMVLAPGYFNAEKSVGFNITVLFILLFTVLFANFAEALAEGRGKAQADSLKKTKQDITANKLVGGSVKTVSSSELRKGDIVIVSQGELIPGDGEVIEGLASVDESAITGESAPVIKEAGGDFGSVTGGTRVVSDEIKVKITSDPGESFLDRMISLVEGAKRQKTPNEIALNTLLISLTLIFLIVVVTLRPIATYLGVDLDIPVMIALLVCLIPTTIGGLLSAIGIAGMDRVTQFNVLAMSGKAVEAAGDINTMILDKTGTITFGNRMASDFVPVGDETEAELTAWAAISSLKDETPEGRSVIELAKKLERSYDSKLAEGGEFVEFKAETRMSGIDLRDGRSVRKGAVDSVKKWVQSKGGVIPANLDSNSDAIARMGGTPLAVAVDNRIYGLIYLKDTVKPGMKERFDELRKMGIKTIMCTGDNPLTAATIAREAGVDDFIAESTPEDKIAVIRREQNEGKLVAMTGDGTNDAPALAQADVGLAMNSGTTAAKEAANMVDLDSDPSKIIEVVAIGKQLLMTRGALTTFSIANDIAKYFAIIPAMFMLAIPEMEALNVMGLGSPSSAIISALIFNAIIIPLLIPLAMKGVSYKAMSSTKLLGRNIFIYGLGGVVVPFAGIKLIDLLVSVWI